MDRAENMRGRIWENFDSFIAAYKVARAAFLFLLTYVLVLSMERALFTW